MSKNIFEKAGDFIKKAETDIGTTVDKAKSKIFGAIDQNGNGEVDIEDVIIMGLKIPGIRVNRDEFLRTEFKKELPPETIEAAVSGTPAGAGISSEMVDRKAHDSIAFERNMVSGISTALGMPGGAAMIATIPADIAQYYGYMLRAAQKLMYLYGFPDIEVKETASGFDAETLNILTVCLGVMYGVAGAGNAIRAMARALGKGVEKQLVKKTLTKGTIYPIVKKIAKWFGVRMTKQVFAGFFKKAIPVVGGVVGGAITYVSFGPCCERLQNTLKDTYLTNPEGRAEIQPDEIIIEAGEDDGNVE